MERKQEEFVNYSVFMCYFFVKKCIKAMETQKNIKFKQNTLNIYYYISFSDFI